MVLDKNDPKKVLSLSIFIEGDDQPVKTPTEIHQPDNIESTPQGLLITEDPGSSQQFQPTEANATTARLMRYTFATERARRCGEGRPVARREHRGSGSPERQGREPGTRALGSVGVERHRRRLCVLRPGAFLATVQAHTYWVEKMLSADDNFPPPGPDYTHKREAGQLVLLRIPGWGGSGAATTEVAPIETNEGAAQAAPSSVQAAAAATAASRSSP